MIHACQLVKKPELQSVCGLLGNETVAGRDSSGFLVALGELVEHFQITWAITPLYELVSGESVEIGFVLELKGGHEPVPTMWGAAVRTARICCWRCASSATGSSLGEEYASPASCERPTTSCVETQTAGWNRVR